MTAAACLGRIMLTYEHRYLSLLCLMSKGSTADKRVLIDYNVDLLQDALVQIFKR